MEWLDGPSNFEGGVATAANLFNCERTTPRALGHIGELQRTARSNFGFYSNLISDCNASSTVDIEANRA
jgi:hypothetical protein